MLSVKSKTIGFDDVAKRVIAITDTEKTSEIICSTPHICDTDNYSEWGLKSLGNTVDFPSEFVTRLSETGSKTLADQIVKDRVDLYFNQGSAPFYAREFENKICGVVSNRYAYFDDDEVIDIIGNSPLSTFEYQLANISPERLHLRAIDRSNPFHVDGDDSNLFMMFFIDNSMVGKASFKIRVGVYRQVCSNGMIIPMNDFVICKAVHRGNKDIAAAFNGSVAFLCAKKNEIQDILSQKGADTAAIVELRNKFDNAYVNAYIHDKLNTSKKESEKIISLFDYYSERYGKRSKWAFVNAVTEFARDLPESQLERRLYLESKALLAA